MAKRCELCGRGGQTGHRRSHSNIPTKVVRDINLQNRSIEGKKRKVCTSCLKGKKA